MDRAALIGFKYGGADRRKSRLCIPHYNRRLAQHSLVRPNAATKPPNILRAHAVAPLAIMRIGIFIQRFDRSYIGLIRTSLKIDRTIGSVQLKNKALLRTFASDMSRKIAFDGGG